MSVLVRPARRTGARAAAPEPPGVAGDPCQSDPAARQKLPPAGSVIAHFAKYSLSPAAASPLYESRCGWDTRAHAWRLPPPRQAREAACPGHRRTGGAGIAVLR